MRRSRQSVWVVAALVATLSMTGLLRPQVASASKAPEPRSFSAFLSFAGWKTYPSGARDGTGDLSVFTGAVSSTYQGRPAGSYTITARVVDRTGSGVRAIDTRDVRVRVSLPGGSVWAQGIVEDPTGKPPTGLHILPVVGGTGGYSSARGTLIIRSVGTTGVYSLGFDVFVDRTFSAERVALGPASARRVGSDDSTAGALRPGQVLVTTRSVSTESAEPAQLVIVSTVVSVTGSNATYAHELRWSAASGSLLARGETTQRLGQAPVSTSATFGILGGTGAYESRRGQLQVAPRARGGLDMRVSLGPKAAGTTVRQTWFERDRAASTILIPGAGRIDTETATMFTMRSKGRDLGDAAHSAQTVEFLADDSSGWVVSVAEQTFAQGTMVVAGWVPLGTGARSWIVIGGTGNFGGASGTVVGDFSSQVWRMRSTYRR